MVDSLQALAIETRVKQLDVSLFDGIKSQSTSDDRRSMLAIQTAVCSRLESFAYLEIGSHLGGSIQPFLLDPRCTRIVSIDKRPTMQPDARGLPFKYAGNSTERMLKNLRGISTDGVSKIATFDVDSSEVATSALQSKMDLCFIDGEHTNAAAERDFAFCKSALAESGVIYFHDCNIVYQAIDAILKRLRASGCLFHAYNLPTSIFVIDFGMNIHEQDSIKEMLSENYKGYLAGLQSMTRYRQFYNLGVFRLLRSAYISVRSIARKASHVGSDTAKAN